MNRYQPHVLVLPEDDANVQIANGFLLDPDLKSGSIKILPVAGGWERVLEQFAEAESKHLEKFTQSYAVLLIDFDGRAERREIANGYIPGHLREGVFVIGSWTTPEELKDGRSFETIGRELAKDCKDKSDGAWNHDLLIHNSAEIARLKATVRGILF